ncbi:uncharacterized protein BO95DRAFT_459378 [Aspergillus brunneoviolaceus CBS 621.78]|uniref:Uncharacterized protein n=1 Tax=Aspergillus brunneoviolaceus CBS 621.78 TaxID=1450534 RepID=A0ACD1GM41_9EURO|nr:hypothetical protein BO95DRAFT_459378 [Aspergillus brunneoviolaceus CBS 621.78]RAH50336.1 hypothetical protein BO95DRAFT_459378 [Aspergillus brunneoviolaceus CBS 621.78]
MAHSINSAVLEYARFHGIASSYTDVDPLEHVQESCVAIPDLLSNSLSQFRDHLDKVHTSLEQSLYHEKLDLKKESAFFLASALRKIEPTDIESHWESILPSWDRYDKLKVETPIFTNDEEKGPPIGARPVCYGLDDFHLSPLEDEISDRDVVLARGLVHGIDTSGENIREEKLDCSKGALRLIQEARKSFDLRFKDLENLLWNELGLKEAASRSRSNSPDLLPVNDDQFSDGEESFPFANESHFSFSIPAENDDGASEDPWNVDARVNDSTHNLLDRTPNVRKESDQPHLHQSHTSPPIEDDIDLSDCVVTQHKSLQDREVSSYASQLSTSDGESTHGISQVTYTEITDNIATSDCLPYKEKVYPVNTPPASDVFAQELRVQPQNTRTDCNHIRQVQSNSQGLGSTTEEQSTSLAKSPVYARERSDHMRIEVTKMPENLSERHEIHSDYIPIRDVETPFGHTSLRKSSCLPQKRKSSNGGTPSKRRSSLGRHNKLSSGIKRPETLHLVASSNLGSLVSFMQVRGLNTKKSVTQIPNFGSPALKAKVGETAPVTPLPEEKASISLDLAQQVPLAPQNLSGGLRLTLSTRLLRSHPDVVRHLEASDLVNSIDYIDPEEDTSATASSAGHSFEHADITIAATTALMLTNTQATTQLFLPGHRSSIPDSSGNINSPLRERVFLLAKTYKIVYVLICHSNPAYSSTGDLLLHKNILRSVTSFIAFCDSLSDFSNVQSLLILACPDTIVSWISAIAGKCQT